MADQLPVTAQTELRGLLAQQATVERTIAEVQQLKARIHDTQQARDAGHGRMEIPVELGMGYTIDGVVEDTSKIIISLGLHDLWVEFDLQEAQEFLDRRLDVLQRRRMELEAPIAQLKSQSQKVSQALRDVLQLTQQSLGNHAAPPHT
ncbi:hypothetical protein OIO90_003366 [Microbotryomycetes sp. JL221]|nr:hypothetical protein OIO90_003366 [Microbotryomycetes sp. JL221]